MHTKIGEGTFINFNITVQDDAPVTIGRNCNLGPNVTIVTPIHPTIAEERNQVLNVPVTFTMHYNSFSIKKLLKSGRLQQEHVDRAVRSIIGILSDKYGNRNLYYRD